MECAMNAKQEKALRELCDRYNVNFTTCEFFEAGLLNGLPDGYVTGSIGGKIYVGCSPDGEISS